MYRINDLTLKKNNNKGRRFTVDFSGRSAKIEVLGNGPTRHKKKTTKLRPFLGRRDHKKSQEPLLKLTIC